MLLLCGYIFFSTIETAAFLIFMQSIFRFGSWQFKWETLLVSVLVSFLSFLLREEFQVKTYFPLMAILIFIGYAKVVIRAPLFWSILMSGLSYVLFLLIQTGIVLFFVQIIGIRFETVQSASIEQFVVQLCTGLVLIGVSLILFLKGYGFSFSFQKFRFKGEDLLGSLLVAIALGSIGAIFIMKNLIIALAVLIILSVVLLYYGMRKEREYDFKLGE